MAGVTRAVGVASFLFLAAAACGTGSSGPIAGTTAPRESGQSRLMDKTFAGKNRCNPQDHTRPFVIEWDGTEISSFESRATTDVIFVRYEGCNLQVVDSCTNDSVRGALGAYGAVDWTSGSVEKVDILNEDELYAKLPLGANVLGARVQGGERFHMEYFVSGTRKATRPAVYRGELDALPGCRGVTHFVYAYNVGAFALGSFSKLDGSAGATVWGIGAGGNHKNESAIEKQGGVLTSCRGESATEVATCKVPIRLALREIEAGEAPDKTAAAAPETPDALNLAGKIAASNERSREANERMASAQRKLTVKDGKGCLTELDAFDRLETRAGNQSTDPKGLGFLRAQCLMVAGQCSVGRALARRSAEARRPNDSAAVIDRDVDGQVAYHCGAAAKEPRDRLLVSLQALREGAQRERTTAKACLAALDAGVAALPSVKPRDEEDRTIKGAARALAEDGSRCLARAGDCPTAWKRFPALQAAWGKAENVDWRTTPDAIRSSFESATYGECVGKDSGPLTPVETLARSIKELDWAEGHSSSTPVAPALCKDLINQGKRALQSLRDDKSDFVKFAPGYLRTEGTKCLTKAGDCGASHAFFVESYREEHRDATALRAEDAFASVDTNGKCNAVLVPGLPPKDAVAQSLRALQAAQRSSGNCKAPFEALKTAVSAARDPELQKTYESDLFARPMRCFDAVAECNEAWSAYVTSNAWRVKPYDAKHLREWFTSSASKCADTMAPGLTPADQYWAAITQMQRGSKTKPREKCVELHRIAKQHVSAVTRSSSDEDDPDVALARCLGRAGDCAGAEEAAKRSSKASNQSWLASFTRSVCEKR